MVGFNTSGARSSMALPVLKLAGRSQCDFVMQSSDAVVVATHWFGRRLWCGGADCPACPVNPPRAVVYFVGWVDSISPGRAVLVEVSPQELARLHGLCEMEGLEITSGLRVRASRSKPKSPIRLEPIDAGGTVVEQLQSTRRCIAAAAVLASMPLPSAESTLAEYQAEVQPAIIRTLVAAISKTE